MTEDISAQSASGGPASSPFAELYTRAVDSLLDIQVEDRRIETASGQTHLLTAGDPAAPPVVVLQGGNITNPVTLSWFQALADEYHLIAPDTPGQPGKSTGETPPAYGPWVCDVLDGLGVDDAAMIGASHGAGVLLEAGVHAPERVTAAALVVPAGFGTPLSMELVRFALPSLSYRVVPRGWLLRQALAPMFTRRASGIDGIVLETIGEVLREDDLAAEFPGPEAAALSGFAAPALVVTGERDPFFPGERTCKRAAEDLPTLVDCLTLPGERHFLSPAGQARATERIRSFLAGQAN